MSTVRPSSSHNWKRKTADSLTALERIECLYKNRSKEKVLSREIYFNSNHKANITKRVAKNAAPAAFYAILKIIPSPSVDSSTAKGNDTITEESKHESSTTAPYGIIDDASSTDTHSPPAAQVIFRSKVKNPAAPASQEWTKPDKSHEYLPTAPAPAPAPKHSGLNKRMVALLAQQAKPTFR